MTLPLTFSDEVKQAKANGVPLVALESTIISHGLPAPQNIELARELEAIIRSEGACPATIALMDGSIKIGLNADELLQLAQCKSVTKVSRRDFATMLVTKEMGATTVSATMIAAQAAGIAVFATGGIGGVHRGAELDFDISADLTELSRTNVIVVCAGAKSILDLPKTLEYLETWGVPVLGFKTHEFPAFHSRSSDLSVDANIKTENQISAIWQMRQELGLQGGMLIANPIERDAEIPRSQIDVWIEIALERAQEQGISGKETTPFLLATLAEISEGKTVEANLALVRSNAKLAARIAQSLS